MFVIEDQERFEILGWLLVQACITKIKATTTITQREGGLESEKG
jgi:hypothetical protein